MASAKEPLPTGVWSWFGPSNQLSGRCPLEGFDAILTPRQGHLVAFPEHYRHWQLLLLVGHQALPRALKLLYRAAVHVMYTH